MKCSNIALWIYGSYIRGDADQYSDIDILAVGDNIFELGEVNRLLPSNLQNENLSVSRYSWPEIEAMANSGSLFLHHLSQEATPVYESDNIKGKLAHLLSSLPCYKKAKKDVVSFYAVIDDVEESVKGECSLAYEMSVLGTVLRHASILGCYIAGCPGFGRSKPVKKIVDVWGLDSKISTEFDELYSFKLHSHCENYNFSEITSSTVLLWCSRIRSLLNKLELQVENYERNMFEAN